MFLTSLYLIPIGCIQDQVRPTSTDSIIKPFNLMDSWVYWHLSVVPLPLGNRCGRPFSSQLSLLSWPIMAPADPVGTQLLTVNGLRVSPHVPRFLRFRQGKNMVQFGQWLMMPRFTQNMTSGRLHESLSPTISALCFGITVIRSSHLKLTRKALHQFVQHSPMPKNGPSVFNVTRFTQTVHGQLAENRS